MKISRRTLIIGGVAVSAAVLLRPRDGGGAYDPYFSALDETLKRAGVGHPRLLLDLDRVDANIDQPVHMLNGAQITRVHDVSAVLVLENRHELARAALFFQVIHFIGQGVSLSARTGWY